MTQQQMTALDSVLEYHRCWTSGDIDGAMQYIADDMVCKAPGADVVGKEQYRAFLGGFASMLTGIDDLAAFGDGDHAVLFYYPHTAMTSTSPTAEHFTIRDGKIAETVLAFDRMSFIPPQS